MERTELSREMLQRFLSYEPDTGCFTWICTTTNRVSVGDVAGVLQKRGYIVIGLFGERWLAHRLAWLYMTGAYPDGQIDHINRCRVDNRFSNLRVVTNGENQHNGSLRKNNRSGVHGVSWDARSGRWMAKICVDRRQMCIGLYDDLEAARQARLQAEQRLHPMRNQRL